MRHRNAFRRLGRDSAHLRSLFRTMVTQLIEHERIETTLAKAKELRRIADKVITLGKKGTLAARRQAAGYLTRDDCVQKLFAELAERYKLRPGGYTRVLHSRRRTNDAAEMAYIEFVDRPGELRPARPPPPSMLPLAAQFGGQS
ncbi:hypothetical protein BSKO_00025 [Bryopsis sp. KO-2023]|nr:hypothetical protein BSKO_00025 [Bryopsis sp. KO-2023]